MANLLSSGSAVEEAIAKALEKRRGEPGWVDDGKWDESFDVPDVIPVQGVGTVGDFSSAKNYRSGFGRNAGDRLMPVAPGSGVVSSAGSNLLGGTEMDNYLNEMEIASAANRSAAEIEAAERYADAQQSAAKRSKGDAIKGAIISVGATAIGAAI
jgi:hypothetical protein